jgi:hypothetical protein
MSKPDKNQETSVNKPQTTDCSLLILLRNTQTDILVNDTAELFCEIM